MVQDYKVNFEDIPKSISQKKNARPGNRPANKAFQISFIKRYFQSKNPDVDPAILDYDALIDSKLTIHENLANLRNDEQLSSFNW
ncbi:MAG: hypothetical protein PXY39_09915 [archaeon]|nr:hypothetical protein [archaeon]